MQCLDLGLYISFTGIITFPSAKNTLNAVKSVPIDRMFVETDAPFLAPQAKRGKENFPGYVKYVAEKIAKTKEMALEEVAEITSENAVKFFKLTVENN
jgi:TatD DNase family protein